jgi:hypothetical protein
VGEKLPLGFVNAGILEAENAGIVKVNPSIAVSIERLSL